MRGLKMTTFCASVYKAITPRIIGNAKVIGASRSHAPETGFEEIYSKPTRIRPSHPPSWVPSPAYDTYPRATRTLQEPGPGVRLWVPLVPLKCV